MCNHSAVTGHFIEIKILPRNNATILYLVYTMHVYMPPQSSVSLYMALQWLCMALRWLHCPGRGPSSQVMALPSVSLYMTLQSSVTLCMARRPSLSSCLKSSVFLCRTLKSSLLIPRPFGVSLNGPSSSQFRLQCLLHKACKVKPKGTPVIGAPIS